MPERTIIDIDGSEAVSNVLLNLLNTFPGLSQNQTITFSVLEEASGIGFFPSTGAALQQNRESINGHVHQVCLYPFVVIYRTAAKTDTQRMRVKEFLDALGKWLEQQPVTINGAVCQLESYPPLASGNRVIRSIARTSPAYCNNVLQNGVEDWAIALQLTYDNDFDK